MQKSILAFSEFGRNPGHPFTNRVQNHQDLCFWRTSYFKGSHQGVSWANCGPESIIFSVDFCLSDDDWLALDSSEIDSDRINTPTVWLGGPSERDHKQCFFKGKLRDYGIFGAKRRKKLRDFCYGIFGAKRRRNLRDFGNLKKHWRRRDRIYNLVRDSRWT